MVSQRNSPTARTQTTLSAICLIAILCFTVGVFALAIVGLARAGRGGRPSSPLIDLDLILGIDKVSGWYGPGNWAAWLFAVGSCCIDRGVGKEKSLDAKQAHLMGLDLNLVVAYGYPFIAAINLLTGMKTYLHDDFPTDEMGRLAAQLIVVKTGAAFGMALAMICTYSWWSGRSHTRTALFSVLFSAFLFWTAKIFELASEASPSYSILRAILWFPRRTRVPVIRERLGLVTSLFWQYSQNDLLGKEFYIWEEDHQFLLLAENSMFGFGLLSTALFCYIVYPGLTKAWGLYRALLVCLSSWVFTFTFLWWVMQFWLQSTKVFVSLLHAPQSAVPLSASKITDLDQIGALIFSGVLVLIFSFGDFVGRESEQILLARDIVISLLQKVGGGLIGGLEQIARAFGMDQVVRWFRRQLGGVNISRNF